MIGPNQVGIVKRGAAIKAVSFFCPFFFVCKLPIKKVV